MGKFHKQLNPNNNKTEIEIKSCKKQDDRLFNPCKKSGFMPKISKEFWENLESIRVKYIKILDSLQNNDKEQINVKITNYFKTNPTMLYLGKLIWDGRELTSQQNNENNAEIKVDRGTQDQEQYQYFPHEIQITYNDIKLIERLENLKLNERKTYIIIYDTSTNQINLEDPNFF